MQNFQYAKDIVPILETSKDTRSKVVSEQPIDLQGNDLNSPVKVTMKAEQVKAHIKQITMLEENKETLYGIVWGQCSTALQEIIKMDAEFEKKDSNFNCIWLLTKCKLILSGVSDCANAYSTLLKAITHVCNICQQPYESNDLYQTRLNALILTLELSSGKHILCSEELFKLKDPQVGPTNAKIKAEEEKLKAMILILRVDTHRYATLQASLEEGVFLNRDKYPQTVTAAYELLQKTCLEVPGSIPRGWCFRRNRNRSKKGTDSTSLLFALHKQGLVAGKNRKTHPHVVCFNCNKAGHYKNQCPTATDVALAQVVLSQNTGKHVNMPVGHCML